MPHRTKTSSPAGLSIDIAGIKLKNPVMTASGTFGYGQEFSHLTDLNSIGAIVVKGVSLLPKLGNPPPRIVETPAGMLNAIGLQNIGVEAFIRDKLPFLRRFDTAVIVNFFGDSVEQYCQVAERLSSVKGVSALEMNISCPNKEEGWLEFGTNPALTERVVRKVRKKTDLPLIVKLSPNVTDIVEIAKAAHRGGADALSLINTVTGVAVDIHTRRPKLKNIKGGLSGPAIKPIALHQVWKVIPAVPIPVIGIGGIMNWQDALEFFIIGASAIQVGTANFRDHNSCKKIVQGLTQYLKKENIESIDAIIGSLKK